MQNNVLVYLEQSAGKYADKVAYADEKEQIRFGELKKLICNIGSFFVHKGIFKQPVAVYMQKSCGSIAACLGVAGSGNFYCPLDAEMPSERAAIILKELQPAFVIVDEEIYTRETELWKQYQAVLYSELTDYEGVEELIRQTCQRIIDTDPLYVLFTSGSTGVPKGVLISHRSVIDYIDWLSETFRFSSEDVLGNQAPFYFDNSVFDIYSVLKNGSRMEIIPKSLFKFPIKLLHYLDEKKINTVFWVPSVLCAAVNLRAITQYQPSCLERVIFAGEVMPNKQLNVWRKYLPNAVYANLYGPTEITVDCTYYIVDREFDDDESLPIGFPCRNTDILVLNEKDERVSAGETGELCVRGSSLALGYYNNPEKTREAFVQNPLNNKYPELIYRTGDMVKYNEHNEIEFCGRKDFQIKHMGHRIELGEIETALGKLDGLAMCACVYDDKKKNIVMFYSGKEIEKEELIRFLATKIPDYMRPNKFHFLEAFPLNANGKIDRKKLLQEYL